MATIVIDNNPIPPSGKDVAIRRRPWPGDTDGKIQTLSNFAVDGWSTGKAVHVSAYDATLKIGYSAIEITDGAITNTRYAGAGSHCDAIKGDFGAVKPCTILIADVTIDGCESGVMPIHCVDGTIGGDVTLRRVRVVNSAHPCHIGGKQAQVGRLVVDSCPGIQIVGAAREVVVTDSPGAVVFGRRYDQPPPPPTDAERIAAMEQRIADLTASYNLSATANQELTARLIEVRELATTQQQRADAAEAKLLVWRTWADSRPR